MFLPTRHPLLVGNFCSFVDSRFVLVRAQNHLVPHVWVWALTAKALVSASQFFAGGTRRFRTASVGSSTGVAIKCTLGLAWKSGCFGSKGLAAYAVTSDSADGSHLVFGCLHHGEILVEAVVLKGSREVVQHGMVGVILAKDALEVVRHPINKGVAHTLWEHLVASKGVYCTHHALVVGGHQDANLVSISICITLLDVVQGGLQLIGVAVADFSKDGCTNLVPG
jgi:hypothetical protein